MDVGLGQKHSTTRLIVDISFSKTFGIDVDVLRTEAGALDSGT